MVFQSLNWRWVSERCARGGARSWMMPATVGCRLVWWKWEEWAAVGVPWLFLDWQWRWRGLHLQLSERSGDERQWAVIAVQWRLWVGSCVVEGDGRTCGEAWLLAAVAVRVWGRWRRRCVEGDVKMEGAEKGKN